MNILFLLTQDLESPSGLGRYFPLAKELARLGANITILALHSHYKSLKETHFVEDGVRICYVAQMHVLKQGNQKLYFPAHKLFHLAAHGAYKMSLAAHNTPSDIIHILKPHPMNSIAGMLNSYGKIVYLDCDDYEAASNRYSGRWQKFIVTLFEKNIPRWVNRITTNTYFM